MFHQMGSFTALDFETANSDRTSICAVGIVRVEAGRIVSKTHQLINPQAPFQYWNTKVHGITQFDVRNAPTFPEYWASIREHFSDVVVAHNAAFDISCLRTTIDHFGLDCPLFDYYCTLCISRKNLHLTSHKLDAVARYFQLPAFNHHNALDDAIICAKIFHRLRNSFDVSPFRKSFVIEQKIKKHQSKRASMAEITMRNKRIDIARSVGLNGGRVDDADSFFDYSEIDFSKSFMVVGKFAEMTIKQVEGLVLHRGGVVKSRIDEYPDYVVVGSRQDVFSRYGEYPDEVYVAKKANISVVSERHFLSQF